MAAWVELAVAFERAVGERLLSAERLVLALPQLFRGLLIECDLAYRNSSRFFVAVARLSSRGYGPEALARMQFWCARSGGVVSSLAAMNEQERSVFDARVERCDVKVRGVAPQVLFEAIGRMVTDAGAPADRPRLAYPRPTLAMDAGGPGWEGVLYDAPQHALFIPGNIAPPVGDDVALALRVAGIDRPIEVKARVSEVRSAGTSGPGAPAGFTLLLQAAPPTLEAALARTRPAAPEAEAKRAAPRYAVKAPVKVIVPPPPAPEKMEAAAAPPMPMARIEYATDQELAADYVANLSQGGAFVRTSRPAAVESRVMLEMRLPGGVKLKAQATVVFVNDAGMGVKFELDAQGNETLSSVIARISARPRRALVVDDDVLVRRMLADALQARGFEVLAAGDGAAGLHLLAEELLTLDLLVTDVEMPNLDGEGFIRAIRQAGGESDLAIVVASGKLEPGVEARLEAVGADAVLDKALGPELIAQAADAVLERKRLQSGR